MSDATDRDRRPHAETPLRDLEDHWVIAAASREIGRSQPVGRTLLGRRVVLFRDGSGDVRALEDRCLHRQVSLSGGCVRAGAVACPYHGFRFDGAGACVHVPSALADHKLPARRLGSYPVIERDESVWVWIGSREPKGPPPRWPHAVLQDYATHEVITGIDAPLLNVLDNFVDTTHTGFVHAGLFRSAPAKHVRARIEEVETGVRIETMGESDVSSLAGRLLVPRGETVRHVDEVILPFTVRVDYWLGSARHLLTTSICTPETAARTRVYTRVSALFPPSSRAVAAMLVPLTRKILAQDKIILEDQAAQIARHGDRFDASTAADAPVLAVARAFLDYCAGRRGEPGRTREVEYRL